MKLKSRYPQTKETKRICHHQAYPKRMAKGSSSKRMEMAEEGNWRH